MDLHPAVAGFDRRAEAYEKGRPSYPAPAMAWLVEALGIREGATVVDLAAGTGKFTRELVPTGARVVAVEPVAGMRDILQQTVPQVDVVEGTAEDMPLPDGSADAVTVAQAFHWFRGDAALAEIHRVLRPAGRLGLVWNRRDLAQPVQAELQDLFNRYRGDTPSHHTEQWKEAFATTDKFGPLATAHFPMEQAVGPDELVARVLSVSFMAQLPEAEQAVVADEVRAVARRYGRPLVLQHITDTYWCQAAEG